MRLCYAFDRGWMDAYQSTRHRAFEGSPQPHRRIPPFLAAAAAVLLNPHYPARAPQSLPYAPRGALHSAAVFEPGDLEPFSACDHWACWSPHHLGARQDHSSSCRAVTHIGIVILPRRLGRCCYCCRWHLSTCAPAPWRAHGRSAILVQRARQQQQESWHAHGRGSLSMSNPAPNGSISNFGRWRWRTRAGGDRQWHLRVVGSPCRWVTRVR